MRERTLTEKLYSAALAGRKNLAVAFIEAGADVNFRDSRGWTPLHSAAARGQGNTIAALYRKGADANVRSARGETPLFLAADRGWYGAVSELVRYCGADPEIADNDGKLPLARAVQNGHTAVAKLLENATNIRSVNSPELICGSSP